MMKRILSVALYTLLLTLLFSGCMGNPSEAVLEGNNQDKDKGVTQGIKYEQQKDTIAVEYSYEYANMRLDLPTDWGYDIMTAEESVDYFGIQFWPNDEPAMTINLSYHINGIGLCGTGVTFEEISFENGLTAIKCTEGTDDRFWIFLIYHDTPGAYAVECSTSKDLWSKYENDIMSILESVEIGKDVLSESEAIEVAKTECTISYDVARAYFDHVNGLWSIRFSTTDGNGETQNIMIDAQGMPNIVSGDYYYFVVKEDSSVEYFTNSKPGTAVITKYIGKGGDVIIPSEIDGKEVTAIGNIFRTHGAFQDCTDITSVIIPDGVTEIQDNAFYSCTNLKTVTIPASVKLLRHCAFADCHNLQSVYFEGDAPETGNYIFDPPLPTIYYQEGANGWTDPWYGCIAEAQ